MTIRIRMAAVLTVTRRLLMVFVAIWLLLHIRRTLAANRIPTTCLLGHWMRTAILPYRLPLRGNRPAILRKATNDAQ